MDWTDIVNQHRAIVWRTIQRLVPDAADAADCFQATFVAAWSLSQRQPIRNWPALLSRLATARALDRCRQASRHRATHSAFPMEGIVDRRIPQPDAVAEAGELEARLRIALADLSPREAEVFCLACLDEFSYREIAAQLDLSVNQVGVILNRARSQLRTKLSSTATPVPQKATENAQ